MLKTAVSYVVLSIGTLGATSTGQAQVERTPFGQVIKNQLDMIALPPSWQPYIGPGSVIYVRWEPRGPVVRGAPTLGYVFQGKNLDNPPPNLPATAIHPLPTVTNVAVQQLQSAGVDLSVNLGKFNPSLMIGTGSRLKLDQTTFSAQGWGPDAQITRRVLLSPTIHDDLTNGVYDTIVSDGHRMFQGYGQGYVVTSVFTVEKMHVEVTKDTKVVAALQSLKNGDCTTSVPASQISKSGTGDGQGSTPASPTTLAPPAATTNAPAVSTTPSNSAKPGKADSTAAADAKTTFSGVVFSDAQVKICRYSDTAYDINVTPGVPIAFTAMEIRYQGMEPFGVAGGKIKDLRDAMRFPD